MAARRINIAGRHDHIHLGAAAGSGTGEKGDPGEAGEDGAAGAPGTPGADGADGADANQSNNAPPSVTPGGGATAGVAPDVSRDDHTHAAPAAAPVAIGAANAAGAANTFNRSDHVHDHGAQTNEDQHALAMRSSKGFMDTDHWRAWYEVRNPFTKGLRSWTVMPRTTDVAGAGMSPPHTGGSTSYQGSPEAPWIQYASGNPANSVAGLIGGDNGVITPAAQYDIVRADWDPTMIWRVRTHTVLTALRYWLGFTNISISLIDTPTTQIVYAFRFSSVAGDTNWQAIVCDGTTVTTVDTGVVATINQDLIMGIQINGQSRVRFWLNDYTTGAEVADVSTNLPVVGSHVTPFFRVTNTGGSARRIRFAWMHLGHN